MAGEGSMFKFLKPRLRPQAIDIQAAAAWGVAATTTALWLIQNFIPLYVYAVICISVLIALLVAAVKVIM
ncbi:hypothetical protein Goari_000154 [Gossypium aridum]|uniref:Uncharacterized protein n=1 Tax=Gossypium aridum TaxID=34290 RepID=A0A7J8YGF3_GOSAI|nr:hypothetical protein [Gossypium aridum]